MKYSQIQHYVFLNQPILDLREIPKNARQQRSVA